MEPFDQSYAALLRESGTHTHLISDHYHYWEDGDATYHNRYSTWEFIRGQEWDKWKAFAQPRVERMKEKYHRIQHPESAEDGRIQAMVNRDFMREESSYCCPRMMSAAFEFLEKNHMADNWLLHLEFFDPHEPFSAPERFRELYTTNYVGPILDWPRYKRLDESGEELAEIRANYAALVTMCDEYFGRLLDWLDRHSMWENTAIIVTTDHGLLLSEHDWWGKNRMPFYNEIAHIPLLVHHPRFAAKAGERRLALTQTIDLMPTILDIFDQPIPETVEGRSLLPILEADGSFREAAIYGMFGAGTNITDGRYAYFCYPDDMTKQDLFEYTLMPMHLKSMFGLEELREATLGAPFEFTRGVPVLKVPARRNVKGQPVGHQSQGGGYEDTVTTLYDLAEDPAQLCPFRDHNIEIRLLESMAAIMRRNGAPPEAFLRLGLTG